MARAPLTLSDAARPRTRTGRTPGSAWCVPRHPQPCAGHPMRPDLTEKSRLQPLRQAVLTTLGVPSTRAHLAACRNAA